MDASENKISSSLPFRSQKVLRSNSKSLLEDQQSLTSKTPEKPAELSSSRTRNRNVALSIKEVRRAAESVRGSNRQQPRHQASEGSKSVRRQIDSWLDGGLSSRSKAPNDKSKKLPEKFEILSKFFDSLDSVMRLLRLRGLASTFSNVCAKIEGLTDRRFSHAHLAQLKFILPEAIELKEVRVLDERTSCFKPDLQISFNFGVLNNQVDLETGNQNMQLRRLFKERLSEFVSSHPEIDDVPKCFLPKSFSVNTSIEQPAISSTNVDGEIAFNHSEENQGFRIIKSTVPMAVTGPSKQKEFIGLSHFSKSSSRRFSQKVVRETEKIDQATKPCDHNSTHSNAETETEFCNAVFSSRPFSPVKQPSNSTCNSDFVETYDSPIRSSALPLPTTPSNLAGRVTMTKEDGVSAKTYDIDSTPAKLVSTPVRLMASTPSIPPPKRSSMSPDDDSSCSAKKLVRRPPRSRSLRFDTNTTEDENEDYIDGSRSGSLDDDIFDILPQSLLQSIREKERKAKEEQTPAITQAKRRQKMIANLPKLFNAIFFLFHKRTVITKEELIYKIIVGNVDIVDRREIEEQLDLLLELVPEWISEKLSLSGDVLICIGKLSNAETVRARLEEAK